MPKKFVVAYFSIFFTLLIIMSLSRSTTEKVRGNFVSLIAPMWNQLDYLKEWWMKISTSEEKLSILALQEELKQLKVENQWLSQQSPTVQEEEKFPYTLSARVIFRSLDTWNHVIWINVGEADNPPSAIKRITKNSPVLAGGSVIGMIDYVGSHQSRVRLMTDPSLTLSVRAVRGGEQEAILAEHVGYILQILQDKKTPKLSHEERETLMHLLERLHESLDRAKKTWYLAKGELQGSVHPFTHAADPILKGTGFNYDFSDDKGGARDLRTGQLAHHPKSSSISILKVNDLLITTGMDGIFPASLKVATVTKIKLLKEGDYFYELEAKPTAGNLNELSHVFVIPPLGYDKGDGG